MNVFSVPDEVPAPVVDYENFNRDVVEQNEIEHQERLKQWLINEGYDKELTGEILYEPMCDGKAAYMVADGGRKWCLIHLPYGDAYHSPNVEFLPKAEVRKRIMRAKAFGIAMG